MLLSGNQKKVHNFKEVDTSDGNYTPHKNNISLHVGGHEIIVSHG